MYLQQLKNIATARSLRSADLARFGNVSRAAVTKWFHQGKTGDGWINIETNTLRQLAHGLHIPENLLLQKPSDLSDLTTQFLWDHIYPNMESFLRAITHAELPALGRLVQILGFHQASQVAGHKVIRLFAQYKKYLKPARQKQLETLWSLYSNPH